MRDVRFATLLKGKIKMTKFIDIHVLQNMPANSINHDDAGQQKTVVYGGSLRQRVSSQAWKRAVRQKFQEEPQDYLAGHRTKHIVKLVADEILKNDTSLSLTDAQDKAKEAVKAGIGSKFESGKGKNEYDTKTLLMLSNSQIEKLAKFLVDNDDIDFKSKDVKTALKQIFTHDNSLDLSLFGRMVAEDESLNVDASSQVAHAFSVNEVVPESDYFTAVDDDSEDNQGAAMLDYTSYMTSVLYRYANLNVDDLKHNLGNDELAEQGIKLFIKDFIMSMPTGKQNSFANVVLPNYIMIQVRDDMPVNLASAFEKSIRSKDGYLDKAIERLQSENEKVQLLLDKPVKTAIINLNDDKSMSLSDAIDSVVSAL